MPKYRKKKLFLEVRKELGPVFHEKDCEIVEGPVRPDQVEVLVSVLRSMQSSSYPVKASA